MKKDKYDAKKTADTVGETSKSGHDFLTSMNLQRMDKRLTSKAD